jgi:hypothetical protein
MYIYNYTRFQARGVSVCVGGCRRAPFIERGTGGRGREGSGAFKAVEAAATSRVPHVLDDAKVLHALQCDEGEPQADGHHTAQLPGS